MASALNCNKVPNPQISDYYCTDAQTFSKLNCQTLTCYENPACTSSYLIAGHHLAECKSVAGEVGASVYCICCTDQAYCSTSSQQYTPHQRGEYLVGDIDVRGIEQQQTANYFDDVTSLSNTFVAHQNDTSPPGNAFPPGATAAIVVLSILLFITVLVVAFLLFRRLKDRRRNKGQYRPKEEEERNVAKYPDLPYLTPPAIEGLI